MSRGSGAVVAVVVLIGLVSRARAQERPDEDAMFGGETTTSPAADPATSTATTTSTSTSLAPSPTTTGTPTPSPAAAKATDSRDDLNLGNPRAATRFSADLAPEDPLKFGGQLYWRTMSTGRQGQYPQDWSLSAPVLLDVYMDARPNERVRAFALGRMSYDPTLPPAGASAATISGASGGSPQGRDSLTASFGQQTRGPSVVLDQLWLRFDILRTVFVTAGKQHVRWGAARLWAPTDYMHQAARNPLLPFDSRAGTTMLKLHLPWEAQGWNFYAYALPESGTAATSRPADVAGALRTEMVFGDLEAGLGVFGRRNNKAKFAGDVSFGLWDLDIFGEAALRNAGDVDFVTFQKAEFAADAGGSTFTTTNTNPPLTVDPGQWDNPEYKSQYLPLLVDAFFPTHRGSGWKPQISTGASYTRKYADKDTFTVGAEYFYNGLGYSDPRAYPGVLFLPHSQPLANPATFFYLGRHYLGVFATAPAPYSWDLTTFTLSTMANLTDRSGITRLDFSYVLLTHIRFEAYGAVHWGQRNGEFRLGIDGTALGSSIPPVQSLAGQLTFPPALFDLGVGLRVAM
jgi:hypothetical protein